MRIQQFLEHHGVSRNPFAEEDAKTDPIFKDHCIESTFHPTWDKVYGDPTEPSTSIVFGEKGAGKTAMRLQIAEHVAQFNRKHPDQRLFVIHYDDFNPFLDRFRSKLSPRQARRPDRVLKQWRLWDHMDAILALGITGLVDHLQRAKHPKHLVDCDISPDAVRQLDRHQARDLLLLAACYDQSTETPFVERWRKLRKQLGFSTLLSYWPLCVGIGWMTLVLLLMIIMAANGSANLLRPLWLYLMLAIAGWGPWVWKWLRCFWQVSKIRKQMRLSNRDGKAFRHVIMQFRWSELAAQPLPDKDSTDDRYEMLGKLQGILDTLGYRGVLVLVDRLDEPHLINGSAELMKAFLWPMLDNKFLKHPGMGLKIMAPIELIRFIEREDREFYQRARLDKQNMVTSFEWTGQALYDVANARLEACAVEGQAPKLRDFISSEVNDQRIIEAFRMLRTPRHLFKFLYRLFVDHCHAHTDGDPVWVISSESFESIFALYQRDLDAFDRGVGAG